MPGTVLEAADLKIIKDTPALKSPGSGGEDRHINTQLWYKVCRGGGEDVAGESGHLLLRVKRGFVEEEGDRFSEF